MNPIPAHFEVLFEQYGMPAMSGLDLSRLEVEWLRFRSSIPEPWKLNNDGREYRVGEVAAAKGYSAKYPTILVPGIVSTVRAACWFSSFQLIIQYRGWRVGPLRQNIGVRSGQLLSCPSHWLKSDNRDTERSCGEDSSGGVGGTTALLRRGVAE